MLLMLDWEDLVWITGGGCCRSVKNGWLCTSWMEVLLLEVGRVEKEQNLGLGVEIGRISSNLGHV